MNVFSNIGITELIIILLLALIVVGPERLPEIGRRLGKGLQDLRKAYENLTRDLGPELQSIQKATQELRESVDSVRSIPQDAVKKVVRAADLEDTMEDLKGMAKEAEQVRKTLSTTAKAVQSPVSTAKSALRGYPPAKQTADQAQAEGQAGDAPASAGSAPDPDQAGGEAASRPAGEAGLDQGEQPAPAVDSDERNEAAEEQVGT